MSLEISRREKARPSVCSAIQRDRPSADPTEKERAKSGALIFGSRRIAIDHERLIVVDRKRFSRFPSGSRIR
jgi:hypothetical protein